MSKSSSYTNDFYSEKAKREGVRARSYYKLEEIDKKFKLFSHLNKKDWVLDLGCSPGSWVQYGLKKTGGKINIVGVDLKETPPFPDFLEQFHFIQKSIEKIDDSTLLSLTGNRKFSVIISDMAPDTSGDPEGDAYLSYELVLHGWELAKRLLKEGGGFIAKYFQGAEMEGLINGIRKESKGLPWFKNHQVKFFKPDSCRKNSREIFLIVR